MGGNEPSGEPLEIRMTGPHDDRSETLIDGEIVAILRRFAPSRDRARRRFGVSSQDGIESADGGGGDIREGRIRGRKKVTSRCEEAAAKRRLGPSSPVAAGRNEGFTKSMS